MQPPHRLTSDQARRLALLVAGHDHIDTADTHIEFNSMDMNAAFIRGFSSFIVIRESASQEPDETLRRYAVSQRTGSVWEMTLCTRYRFPELVHLQHELLGKNADASDDEIAMEKRRLGCDVNNPRPAM
uniref:Effector immunity protein Tgi2PP domain-containing protein n=1 Tax=Paracidobacterium acidisoli TaxID=2303751 RepID=A0A372IMP9_9BACT